MALIASDPVCKLARFALNAADAPALAAFYENAFGFCTTAIERLKGPAFESLMGVQGGANRITLALGREIVELYQFDRPGRPYPFGCAVSGLLFQHFAIVVPDMGRAWQRLRATGGWSPITRGIPQHLPESSGGVTAFKFRDPEGHPLELLEFPPNGTPLKWRKANGGATALGIDHSAISVADTAVSSAFYDALGFKVLSRSFNRGPEQEALDDIADVQVEVTALAPAQSSPHVELLCYCCQPCKIPAKTKGNDIAATRIVLELCDMGDESPFLPARSLLDPDAHRLIIIALDRDPRGSHDA